MLFPRPCSPAERLRRGAVLLLSFWLCPFAVAGQQRVPPVPPAPPGRGMGLLDALRLMAEHDPNLALEESLVRSAQGSLLAARGSFDPVFTTSFEEEEASEPLTEATSRERALVTNSFGVSQRFRSGLSLEPELGLVRTDGTGTGADNLGTFSLTVRQPLLRGRGRAVNAASELAAENQVAASRLDLRHTTAERILTVASQYWLARAAALDVEILQEAEDRARELLATTRRLVEADVTPAAELVQVEANLVSKEAARIGGERELFAARQALGREIGLERARIAGLPVPSDPFPVVAPAAVPPAATRPGSGLLSEVIAGALARRADLQAARERRNAAEALLRAADDALKPRLDLVFVPSYSGFVEGTGAESFFSPLYRNVPGASSTLGLTLSWPTWNRQARGDRLRFEAVREQNALLEDLLARRIGADVPTALDAVGRHAEQLERAGEAVRLFERAVANEEKKLQAGTSTLIDVITQRDRLTAARQAQVSAHLSLALALARLRFETGTLPEAADEATRAALTTLPFGEEAAQ